MKNIIQTILKILARLVLLRYRPDIIGITGSVGKSSTKEAVFVVLKHQFNVRRNEKNYNNELGLPLAIIGKESPNKSVFGWLGVFLKALSLILIGSRKYPKILVLEMGADKPGDIGYLLKIIPKKLLRIGIVTAIGASHLEFFKGIDNVLKEKKQLLSGVRDDGWAIINQDDERSGQLKERINSKILTYGLDEKADARAIEKRFSEDKGINFKLMYKGSFVPIHLSDALGEHQIYAALAGAAVGISYHLNLVAISESLKNYKSLPGRMKRIPGIKQTTIIDDSYNSSPSACKRALETLARLASRGRKFAVLGDMLELGGYTEEAHREIGRLVAKLGIDQLITIGEAAKDIATSALRAGMDKQDIFKFSASEEAGKFIQERLEHGDLILIKGSQGMRLEKITKEIMAEPLKAKKLLVRQSEQWLKR
ncbi:UDP-N-acetylmuramoyl-tripeptide--D-alanyl-D-alanine ligase [Candidatus Parcubacteria bacterium]|nr:UDP-N-acetylmuramoyl-tripeptide--D-alanyl-D-alanine ligase [Candidatus Parcubacteria bacterium]